MYAVAIVVLPVVVEVVLAAVVKVATILSAVVAAQPQDWFQDVLMASCVMAFPNDIETKPTHPSCALECASSRFFISWSWRPLPASSVSY